jgi:hypothetical protein
MWNKKYNIAHKYNQNKYHKIISVDIEKSFDKIQHTFMIKAPKKQEKERISTNKDYI